MAVYSWQLALVVWVCFAPLFLSLRFFQRRLSAAYGVVRRQVGVMLSAISEPVVGAAVVRSYAVEAPHPGPHRRRRSPRTRPPAPAPRASRRSRSPSAGISAGLANAGVIVVGISARASRGEHHRRPGAGLRLPGHALRRAGADGHPDPHRRPERPRRLAPGDRHPRDPGRPRRPRRGRAQPAARADRRRASTTSTSPTPAARRCSATSPCTSPPGSRVAIVGETGSGKSTFAKLLTRLMDPSARRRAASTASTSARSARPRCGAAWCWCRRRASSSTTPSGPTSATAASTPTTRS